MSDEVKKIRVIVADDHLGIRKSIRKLLSQRLDIEVVGESGDGLETLQLVEELEPDVLLLDIDMPGLNGLEVAKQLHKDCSQVHIVIVSGYGDLAYIRLVMNEGVSGYLVKDEAPGKIIDAVRQASKGIFVGTPSVKNLSSIPA